MTGKYEDKMALDMPFGEATERYIGVDPAEYAAVVAKSKSAKPEAERKRPTPKPDQTNVTKLRGKPKR